MDDFDNAMLSLALRDAFPQIRFVSGVNAFPSPRLVEGPSIPECGSNVARLYFPPPDWEPEFEVVNSCPPSYALTNLPRPWFIYPRSHWFWGSKGAPDAKWAFSLPTPEASQVKCIFDRNSEEEYRIVQSVSRLLERLATNRLKGGLSARPVKTREIRGSYVWAGHHVLEWCAHAPDRMLDGTCRPPDDWRFPDEPWLLELRRRIEEQFGRDYGGPRWPF